MDPVDQEQQNMGETKEVEQGIDSLGIVDAQEMEEMQLSKKKKNADEDEEQEPGPMVECIERGRKQMPIVWVGERGEKPNHVSKVEQGFLPSEESN